jgi:hypothetical protein
METLLKFWRFFPKFIFGLALIISIGVFFISQRGGVAFIDSILATDIKKVGTLVPSLLVLFAFLSLGVIGIFFLNIFILFFKFIFLSAVRLTVFSKLLDRVNLSFLYMSVSDFGVDFFKKNKADILEYCFLKNWSQPNVQDSFPKLYRHIKRVGLHVESVQNSNLIQLLDYFQAVTQEQSKRDYLQDRIDVIYYTFIMMFFIGIDVYCFFGFSGYFLCYTCACAVVYVLLLGELHSVKLRLASYVVTGYIDAFTIGAGASISDRDVL